MYPIYCVIPIDSKCQCVLGILRASSIQGGWVVHVQPSLSKRDTSEIKTTNIMTCEHLWTNCSYCLQSACIIYQTEKYIIWSVPMMAVCCSTGNSSVNPKGIQRRLEIIRNQTENNWNSVRWINTLSALGDIEGHYIDKKLQSMRSRVIDWTIDPSFLQLTELFDILICWI